MTVNKVVAIHQPNFFPWMGYFDKMNRADVFIYLDHVSNNPRSALWTKRVKILGSEHWLTLSLKNRSSELSIPINEMEIDNPKIQASKHLKTIDLNYRKSPYFNEIFPLIHAFYEDDSPFISKRNMDFIESVCNKIGISSERKVSSSLKCEGRATEMLVNLCQTCGASVYMEGGGAGGYQEDDKFNSNSIRIVKQDFVPMAYPQIKALHFVPGLSIIDALMNIGFQGLTQIYTPQ
jgi:hypothetical protein